MNTSTPFFPGFHRVLFGRPSASAQKHLQQQVEALQRASLCQLAKLFEPWVPPQELSSSGKQRKRCFPVAVTFWAFLSQTLSPGRACRETLRKVQGWCAAHKLPIPKANTGAYCKARKRLDGRRLRKLHRYAATKLQRAVRPEQLWEDRCVKVVDGTGLSMPDTRRNQRDYPQPSNQKKGCGFPVVKLVGCFCLSSGALIDWAQGTLRHHEGRLFRNLWKCFGQGDVLLADRGFCSYELVASLLGRGVDSVLRLHQARPTAFCQGRPLGENQRLVRWDKPSQRPKAAAPAEWDQLPSSLVMRYVKIRVSRPGFRTRELIVVTTLTDPVRYTAEALADLYYRRWSVELFFRDIKITLGMDVLRCKSPEMVRKEITMHAIAYNLIRGLMQEAAALYEVRLERISFKGTVDTLRQWEEVFHAAGNKPTEMKRLKAQLLKLLAEDLVPERPGRREPRAKKRRPKKYALLNKPRHEKVDGWHRNYYPKKVQKDA